MKHFIFKQAPWKRVIRHMAWGGCLVVLFTVGLATIWYELYLKDRIYPRARLAGVVLDYKTSDEAEQEVGRVVETYVKSLSNPSLVYEGAAYELTGLVDAFEHDVEASVGVLYKGGREVEFLKALEHRWVRLTRGENLNIETRIDESWWEATMATVSAKLASPFIPETWEVRTDTSGKTVVTVIPSTAGMAIETDLLNKQLTEALAGLKPLPTKLPVEVVSSPLTEADLNEAEARANKYLTNSLVVRNEEASDSAGFSLSGADLIPFLAVGGGFNTEVIRNYLTQTAETINRSPVEAKFEFNDATQKVEAFSAPKDGYRVDVEASIAILTKGLETLEEGTNSATLTLKGTVFKPTITLNEVNDLGIRELIGRGESSYKGSIATRVHNVALTAAKINGTLIKPGEIFSFNDTVGDISGATGFQQAYVIRNGRTELGDGGGVCQDSTTLFRAVLNAGLPIVERRAHSYRVGYYEQDTKAGMDATVYSPTTDFQFKNDTPSHILVQAKADSAARYLVIELYGTHDGRRSEIANHRVWDVTPPPPDVYVDDPTMKVGEVKQVDWKTAGAKAAFDYKVWRGNDLVLEKTFASNYKPWASVYLRGTQP